jgi:hypothetical protein
MSSSPYLLVGCRIRGLGVEPRLMGFRRQLGARQPLHLIARPPMEMYCYMIETIHDKVYSLLDDPRLLSMQCYQHLSLAIRQCSLTQAR